MPSAPTTLSGQSGNNSEFDELGLPPPVDAGSKKTISSGAPPPAFAGYMQKKVDVAAANKERLEKERQAKEAEMKAA